MDANPRVLAFGSTLGLCLVLLPGCNTGGIGFVSKNRLDEATKLTQALRVENSQLKDVALNLRSENQDLTQRAVDDARTIRTLDQANRRFEKAITAYQTDRERLEASYEKIQRVARMPRDTRLSSDWNDALDRYAREIPGAEFDRTSGTLTIPTDGLFQRAEDGLTPEGKKRLDALAKLIADASSADGEAPDVQIDGHVALSPVRLTGADDQAEKSRAEELSLARAAKAREVLGRTKGPVPRFSVAGHGSSRPISEADDDLSRARNRRLEITLKPPMR